MQWEPYHQAFENPHWHIYYQTMVINVITYGDIDFYLVADYRTSSWLVPNLSSTFMSLVDLPWDHSKNKVNITDNY